MVIKFHNYNNFHDRNFCVNWLDLSVLPLFVIGITDITHDMFKSFVVFSITMMLFSDNILLMPLDPIEPYVGPGVKFVQGTTAFSFMTFSIFTLLSSLIVSLDLPIIVLMISIIVVMIKTKYNNPRIQSSKLFRVLIVILLSDVLLRSPELINRYEDVKTISAVVALVTHAYIGVLAGLINGFTDGYLLSPLILTAIFPCRHETQHDLTIMRIPVDNELSSRLHYVGLIPLILNYMRCVYRFKNWFRVLVFIVTSLLFKFCEGELGIYFEGILLIYMITFIN